jgi:anthranilate phosphoribosyltransferase
MIANTLITLRAGERLDRRQIVSCLESIAGGQASPSQIGAFLMALAMRGETADEMTGAAQFLRRHVTPVKAPEDTMDCCGTGGDLSGTKNISTAVAFIVASCGIPVAKHGNRAASSKSGAADVLEALGVNIVLDTNRCETALDRFGFCFLMAPRHHAVLKPLAGLRKELGFRTIFNLMGPLANPANTKQQLIGVYDKALLRPFAEVLQALGTRCAWIVHGEDGLDEISLSGRSFVAALRNGRIEEFELSPTDFGLSKIDLHDIAGGDARENAEAMKALFGGMQSAYRDIVLANSAACLMIAGHAGDLRDGVAKAAQAIDDGRTLALFENYRNFTNSA